MDDYFIQNTLVPCVLMVAILAVSVYLFYLIYFKMPRKDAYIKSITEDVPQDYGNPRDIKRVNDMIDKFKYKDKLNFRHLPETASAKDVALGELVCEELAVISRHLNKIGFIADMHKELMTKKMKSGSIDSDGKPAFNIMDLDEIDRIIGLEK